MIFSWPMVLWGLAVVPLLIAGYILLIAHKRRAAARYSAWAAAGDKPRGSAFREHLPVGLLLISVIALIGAMARPNAVLTLPSRHDVLMLAMDVSGSMKATDIQPTRLAAAQKAAREFIERQPHSTQIGLVAFASTAVVVQRPTTNREDLLQAIDRLQIQDGTSVGGAILISLQALFPKEDIDIVDPRQAKRDEALMVKPPPKPAVPAGSETSAAIVLLTDGQANTRPDPMAAAKLAADHGVRVFTVGIGTAKGQVIKENGVSMRVQLDEDGLKQIADTTRGRYFEASSANDLRDIYRELNTRLVTETREVEISAFFIAAAVVTAMLGAALSLLWFHRIV